MLKRQRRSMEADANDLKPRTETLFAMVDRIEKAYEPADQLPIDLESLSEGRQKVSDMVDGVAVNYNKVSDIREHGETIRKHWTRLSLRPAGFSNKQVPYICTFRPDLQPTLSTTDNVFVTVLPATGRQ